MHRDGDAKQIEGIYLLNDITLLDVYDTYVSAVWQAAPSL